ncbi:hypothetical protein EN943_23125 [Mesorhizobium sp. M7A.F.Ca.US.006.01.1.1]|nr:hypothetical protein EN943_23125 [Mesorhizobium sp. M7A.F.Ca.US.006.01.1.1]
MSLGRASVLKGEKEAARPSYVFDGEEDEKAGKRRNLGTFETREAAEKHEREVRYFKRGRVVGRRSREGFKGKGDHISVEPIS